MTVKASVMSASQQQFDVSNQVQDRLASREIYMHWIVLVFSTLHLTLRDFEFIIHALPKFLSSALILAAPETAHVVE
jgi:hypothetical protein